MVTYNKEQVVELMDLGFFFAQWIDTKLFKKLLKKKDRIQRIESISKARIHIEDQPQGTHFNKRYVLI